MSIDTVAPSIPDNPDQGIENGCLVVTSEELRDIFEPVIRKVLILLTQQIDTVRAIRNSQTVPILLVGGFGSSNYLKRRIEEEFENYEVLQPPNL